MLPAALVQYRHVRPERAANSIRISEIRQRERGHLRGTVQDVIQELGHHLKLTKAEKALPDIYRCLESDREHARKIKEVVTDGHIQSGYYQLPPVKDKINRFILFRLGKKGEATLIYIEGEIDSDDLVTLIFSKD